MLNPEITVKSYFKNSISQLKNCKNFSMMITNQKKLQLYVEKVKLISQKLLLFLAYKTTNLIHNQMTSTYYAQD